MINKELYDKTIKILVQAYVNDTLQHGWCSSCAVGNLVAYGMGTKPVKNSNVFGNGSFADWSMLFMTSIESDPISCISKKIQKFKAQYLDPSVCSNTSTQIGATGYEWYHLALIEQAFEREIVNDEDNHSERDTFDGLMAVIDVLGEIHEVDPIETEETKKLFVKC
jgi:hypothetical protein